MALATASVATAADSLSRTGARTVYQTVAEQLVVTDAAFSQALDMGGDNAVEVGVTAAVFAGGAASVTVEVEEGNDLQNWTNLGGDHVDAIGYKPVKITAIASRYVRLKYKADAGTVVLSATVETQRL